MGYGYLADRNRVPTATLTSSAAYQANAPLDNVKTLPLVAAAVTTTLGTAGGPVTITGAFPERYPCTYGGLFDTNLRQAARWRLELFSSAVTLDATTRLFDTRGADGADRAVIPSLTDWRDLRWGDPNLFRGDLPPEDFALYPTHVHCIVPVCRPAAFRWTLYGPAYEADNSEATGYSIGHMWLSDGVPLARHMDSEDVYTPTDEITRFPGGGVSVEPGTGYRSVTIQRAVAARGLRDALFDMARRVDWSRPVVWLPDVDSLGDCFRYGGLFQKREPHANRWIAPKLTAGAIHLEEITV
ncbi:hypothetical protein [Brevundimonas sp.]|uniref:hypothetical protein n=1 Tax=Brevundimonas sp. TaxID=1871086 RepID=UPI002D6E61D1|nr:hypothetical protein [Brevundimonas sp.]HYD29187.1 hypothetical protein [Brevundimonas sp.]